MIYAPGKFFCSLVGLALAVSLLLSASALAAKRTGQLIVPDNAYVTGSAYGQGWKCSFGFAQVDDSCVAIVVPENAYVSERGNSWLCERGYRRVGERCINIEVPANGYLDESTKKGWQCDRGYQAMRDTCELIVVPPNAYATNASFGDLWKCEREYRSVGDECVKIQVPDNAFFVELSYGPGWQCERGFEPTAERSCQKLALPENAHLTRDGNQWECNLPYSRRGDTCIER